MLLCRIVSTPLWQGFGKQTRTQVYIITNTVDSPVLHLWKLHRTHSLFLHGALFPLTSLLKSMIWLHFFLLLQLLSKGVESSKFGTFSIFRARSVTASKNATVKNPKYGKLEEVHITNVNSNVTEEIVLNVISKISKASECGALDKVQYFLRQSSCLVTVPKRPFGWTNIAFNVNITSSPSHKVKCVDSGELSRINFSSFGSKDGLKVQFSIRLRDGNLMIERRSSHQEPVKLVSQVVGTLEAVLVNLFKRELALRAARSQQFRAVKLHSDAARKARKRQELDKIIHPEKYRTKSATVRRDQEGGSGRFTPSASTQARRTKSKGG